jgi:hypothetical protein
VSCRDAPSSASSGTSRPRHHSASWGWFARQTELRKVPSENLPGRTTGVDEEARRTTDSTDVPPSSAPRHGAGSSWPIRLPSSVMSRRNQESDVEGKSFRSLGRTRAASTARVVWRQNGPLMEYGDQACTTLAPRDTDTLRYSQVLSFTTFWLVKALTCGFRPPLQGEGRGFESLSAHRKAGPRRWTPQPLFCRSRPITTRRTICG